MIKYQGETYGSLERELSMTSLNRKSYILSPKQPLGCIPDLSQSLLQGSKFDVNCKIINNQISASYNVPNAKELPVYIKVAKISGNPDNLKTLQDNIHLIQIMEGFLLLLQFFLITCFTINIWNLGTKLNKKILEEQTILEQEKEYLKVIECIINIPIVAVIIIFLGYGGNSILQYAEVNFFKQAYSESSLLIASLLKIALTFCSYITIILFLFFEILQNNRIHLEFNSERPSNFFIFRPIRLSIKQDSN